MRIHSDIIVNRDIYDATDYATRLTRTTAKDRGVYAHATVRATRMDLHGSRKRARAFDVLLTGTNTRGQNGNPRTPAATYDEWGNFLAHLFSIDPAMVCDYYASAEDFHAKTDGKYRATTNA